MVYLSYVTAVFIAERGQIVLCSGPPSTSLMILGELSAPCFYCYTKVPESSAFSLRKQVMLGKRPEKGTPKGKRDIGIGIILDSLDLAAEMIGVTQHTSSLEYFLPPNRSCLHYKTTAHNSAQLDV